MATTNDSTKNSMSSANASNSLVGRFFRFFFEFRFITILGVIIGSIVYNVHSETNPLNVILTTPDLYIIGFLIVFALNFICWIFIDKATFYNIKTRLLDLVFDFVFLILSGLSTVGTLFLINTFFL